MPPSITSGVRIGTAAITTRGMDEAASITIADAMHEIFASKLDPGVIIKSKERMLALTSKFPLGEM